MANEFVNMMAHLVRQGALTLDLVPETSRADVRRELNRQANEELLISQAALERAEAILRSMQDV